jgi:hypothetical protein
VTRQSLKSEPPTPNPNRKNLSFAEALRFLGVPPVVCGSKPLAGTGRWNTQIEDETCASCRESAMRARAKENRNLDSGGV